MSKRYTKAEDDYLVKKLAKHGETNIDIEKIAKKLNRTPSSVNYRIRYLRDHHMFAEFTTEEKKMLMEKVKPYVDAGKKIRWQDISDFYFYRPRRQACLLKRMYHMIRDGYISEENEEHDEEEEEEEKEEPIVLDSETEDTDLDQELDSFFDSPETSPLVTPKSPVIGNLSPKPKPSFGVPASTSPKLPTWTATFGPTIRAWQNPETNQAMFQLNVHKNPFTTELPGFYSMKTKIVDRPQVMLILPDNN